MWLVKSHNPMIPSNNRDLLKNASIFFRLKNKIVLKHSTNTKIKYDKSENLFKKFLPTKSCSKTKNSNTTYKRGYICHIRITVRMF